MDERGRIEMLARVLAAGARPHPGVEFGIGDDAAVLATPSPGARLVWTIDEQVEGVHFRRDLVSWRDLGWRATMAAASDVAAMGAAPWCALAALVLADDVNDEALEAIACGQRDAAAEVGAPVVGGNLSRGPVVSIATTLLGTCERAVPRSGARAGDTLWLAGRVGLAAAGLRALEQGRGNEPAFADAVAAWRRPRALVVEAARMAGVAHAAVDVSDGLARDAGHVAHASGVRIVLEAAALVEDSGLIDAAAALGAEPLDLALHGGEDYALVVASDLDAGLEDAGFRRIGEVRAGRGLALCSVDGEHDVEPRGYDHFRSPARR